MDQNSSNAGRMSTQPLGQPPEEQPASAQPPSNASYAPQPQWTPPIYPPAGPQPQNQGQPAMQPVNPTPPTSPPAGVQPQNQGQPVMQPVNPTPPPATQPPAFGQPPQSQGATQPVYPPPPGYSPASPPPAGYPPPPGYPQPGYPPGAPYPPPPGYAAPQQKSGVPVWLWVGFGVVLVVILFCVGSVLFAGYLGGQVTKSFSKISASLESGSYTTVLNFYTYLDSAEYTSAYSLLGGNAALNYTPDSLRSSWLALTKARGQVIPNPIFANIDENGTSATIDQPLTTSKGQNYSVHLKLTKSGDDWLITDATPALIPKP